MSDRKTVQRILMSTPDIDKMKDTQNDTIETKSILFQSPRRYARATVTFLLDEIPALFTSGMELKTEVEVEDEEDLDREAPEPLDKCEEFEDDGKTVLLWKPSPLARLALFLEENGFASSTSPSEESLVAILP